MGEWRKGLLMGRRDALRNVMRGWRASTSNDALKSPYSLEVTLQSNSRVTPG